MARALTSDTEAWVAALHFSRIGHASRNRHIATLVEMLQVGENLELGVVEGRRDMSERRRPLLEDFKNSLVPLQATFANLFNQVHQRRQPSHNQDGGQNDTVC